jgi:hypothetical protein
MNLPTNIRACHSCLRCEMCKEFVLLLGYWSKANMSVDHIMASKHLYSMIYNRSSQSKHNLMIYSCSSQSFPWHRLWTELHLVGHLASSVSEDPPSILCIRGPSTHLTATCSILVQGWSGSWCVLTKTVIAGGK